MAAAEATSSGSSRRSGRLAGARRWAWALILLILLAYAGRLWLRDLRAVGSGVWAAIRRAVSTGALTTDAPLHAVPAAAVTVAVIVAWIVLAVAAPRLRGLRSLLLDGRLTLGMSLFAIAGIAMLLLLAETAILPPGVPTPPWIAGLIALVLVAGAIGVAERRTRRSAPANPDPTERGAGPDAEDGAAPAVELPGPGAATGLARPSWAYRLLQVLAAVALALLLFALGRDIVHLAVFRPPAAGDEAYFWWRATDQLHALGFREYMSSFEVAGYPPGYPIASDLLVGWLPDRVFDAAGRALPFIYGFTALWILVHRAVTWRTMLSPVAGIYYVLAFLLLERLSFVRDMLFRLWYGEAPAIVVFALLLVVVDQARRGEPGADSRPRLVALGLLGLGLGAFGVLIKPPLSFLLVPAIVPTLAIVGLLVRRRGEPLRPFLVTLASIALGGVLAQLAWGAVLAQSGHSSFYSIDLRALIDLHPERSFSKLVPYVLSVFQPVWVSFLLVSALALLADWRRFLPLWLVSVGMIASILVLYLGVWSDVEHESGARYILHGAYGWTLFALGALAPGIARTVAGWTDWLRVAHLRSWLAGLRARMATDTPGA